MKGVKRSVVTYIQLFVTVDAEGNRRHRAIVYRVRTNGRGQRHYENVTEASAKRCAAVDFPVPF